MNPLDPIITDWIMTPSVISAVNTLTGYENNLFQFVSSGFDNASINLKINRTESQKMSISIYSSEGKLITTIFSGIAVPNSQIRFDASLLSSGMYFIKAETTNSQQTIKYALVK